MASNGTMAYVRELPDCDICKYFPDYPSRPPRKAHYDVKTVDGRWANVCEQHRASHAMYKELGLGRGQRLVLTPSTTRVTADGPKPLDRGDI